MEQLGLKLRVQSDKTIIKTAVGRVRNNRTLDKKPTGYLPSPGGLYDKLIFGSDNGCNCGFMKRGSVGTCYCGVTVMKPEEFVKVHAYYEGSIPWVNLYAIQDFIQSFNSGFPKIVETIGYLESIEDIWCLSFELIQNDPTAEEMERLGGIVLDYKTTSKGEITGSYKVHIHEVADDTPIRSIGLVGLYAISYGTLGGQDTRWVRRVVNRVIKISSPALRAFSIYGDGTPAYHPMTVNYVAFITAQLLLDPFNANSAMTAKVMSGDYDSFDFAAACLSIQRMYEAIQNSSSLVASSKESELRNMYQQRIAKTGRTNISINPDLELDEVEIPFSIAYEAVKQDILVYLKNNYPDKNAMELYYTLDDAAVNACKYICDNGCVCIERPPTLHKYNVMSYRIRLWNGITMRLPPLTMEPFNADTDGDQMSMWFVTDPELAKDTLSKSSPRCFWFYEKNSKVIWSFNGSYLIGLYYATKPNGSLPESGEVLEFKTREEVVDNFNAGKLEYDQRVKVSETFTTVGREIVSYIIGNDLDVLIGEDKAINGSNINQILTAMYDLDDRYEALKQLQDISLMCSTLNGTSTPSVSELADLGKGIPGVDEILKSNDPDSVKENKIKDCISQAIRDRSTEIPSLGEQLLGSDKVTPKVMNELTLGRVVINAKGETEYSYDNLLNGMSEQTYFKHAMTSRKISEQKQNQVAASGYNTRQLADLALDIIYVADKPAEDQVGALVERKYVIGRQDVNGNIVKAKGDNEDLVRVKSSIFTKTMSIGSDVIRTDIFKYTTGANIGVGMMTGLSEPLTQGGLELKHAGALIALETGEFIYNPKGGVASGKIKEIGTRLLTIEENGKDVMYCIPEIYDAPARFKVGAVVNPGDTLLYSLNQRKPDWKFMQIASLIGSHVVGKKLPMKTLAYAMSDGTIQYRASGNGVQVSTDGIHWYVTDPTAVYFYPEGTKVKKFQRICTAIHDPAILKLMPDRGEQYHIFHNQFMESWGSYENSEIIEMLFLCMTTKGELTPIKKIMTSERSLISSLNFGFCAKALESYYNRDIGTDFLTKFIFDYNNTSETASDVASMEKE